MNQEQNNFNTQGNNGIPNNQSLNNQGLNNPFNQNIYQNTNVNQQMYSNQPQSTANNQQPINQMNIQQPTPQPMQNINMSSNYIQKPVQSQMNNVNNQQFIQTPSQLPKQKKSNKVLILIAILLVVGILVGVLYFANQGKKQTSNNNGMNGTIGEEKNNPKQEVFVVTIGHEDHGKSMLTSAITKLYGDFVSYDDIVDVEESRINSVKFSYASVEYETKKRVYNHYNLLHHADYVKSIISGTLEELHLLDGAIIVVSVTDGVTPETREQLRLLYQAGISKVVVYLNELGLVDNINEIDLVEKEIRELLKEYGLDGDKTPIIKGSALKALQGDTTAEKSIHDLISAMDNWIEPADSPNKDFLMTVKDVLSFSDKETVVTGRVDRGTVEVGDTVQIAGLNDENRTAIVSNIESSKQEDYAVAGDNVGITLNGITQKEVKIGQVLAKPNSIAISTSYDANIYFLSKEENEVVIPIINDCKAEFNFRNENINGTIKLLDNMQKLNPGDNALLSITLETPVAIERGTIFSIKLNGSIIAMGRVANVY